GVSAHLDEKTGNGISAARKDRADSRCGEGAGPPNSGQPRGLARSSQAVVAKARPLRGPPSCGPVLREDSRLNARSSPAAGSCAAGLTVHNPNGGKEWRGSWRAMG